MDKHFYTSEQTAFLVLEIDKLRNESYTINEAVEVVLPMFKERWPKFTGTLIALKHKYYYAKKVRKIDVEGGKTGHIVVERKGEKWCQVFPSLEEAMKSVNGDMSRYSFYSAKPIKIKTKTVYAVEG